MKKVRLTIKGNFKVCCFKLILKKKFNVIKFEVFFSKVFGHLPETRLTFFVVFDSLEGHEAEVTCVEWCSKDLRLITCADDMRHRTWYVRQFHF